MLCELFRESGFCVDFESDGGRGGARAVSGVYDLVVLDVMLPTEGGFAVLRSIRERSQVPVLMLTEKCGPSDRVMSFGLGADDCLAKPFHPEELLARVRAILRRAARAAPWLAEPLIVGELSMFPESRDARFRGRLLDLTAMECEILLHLVRSCGRVVSRDELSFHLYKRPASPYDRSIDTHISRIRRKIGEEGRDLILCVRGTGYQFRCRRLSADTGGGA
jgi:DNA-binding response OmpR family regulator